MLKQQLSQLDDRLDGGINDSESFPPFWENECLPKLAFWIEESETWGGEELTLTGTYYVPGASLVAQMVKNPPAMREAWVRSLGWEDPLEETVRHD